MSTRRACIDIGSNTTRLLVADCDLDGTLHGVHQERAFTRIGRAVREWGSIPAAKIEEVLRVVTRQLSTAARLGASDVSGVATAAIRRAANGQQLADVIRERCGLEVEILSARDEARLAFVGAARTLRRGADGELGVVDVGGSSSELVVGTPPDATRWWTSVQLGSGDLADQWFAEDPPSAAELRGAREQVAQALSDVKVPRPAQAVAVGGSASSLYRLAGPLLGSESLGATMQLLCSRRAEELARERDLDPARVRLLPAGLVILEAVVEKFGRPLWIGRGGVREGVLLEARR